MNLLFILQSPMYFVFQAIGSGLMGSFCLFLTQVQIALLMQIKLGIAITNVNGYQLSNTKIPYYFLQQDKAREQKCRTPTNQKVITRAYLVLPLAFVITISGGIFGSILYIQSLLSRKMVCSHFHCLILTQQYCIHLSVFVYPLYWV